jgi:hypothetical protein
VPVERPEAVQLMVFGCRLKVSETRRDTAALATTLNMRARVHLRHHASHFPIVDDCLARDGSWMRRRSDLPCLSLLTVLQLCCC